MWSSVHPRSWWGWVRCDMGGLPRRRGRRRTGPSWWCGRAAVARRGTSTAPSSTCGIPVAAFFPTRTRLADLRTLMCVVLAGRRMASLDVTKALCHIPPWVCEFACRGRTCGPLVAPVGLPVAPSILPQVTRAPLTGLRKEHLLHVTAYVGGMRMVGRTAGSTRAAVRAACGHLTQPSVCCVAGQVAPGARPAPGAPWHGRGPAAWLGGIWCWRRPRR